MLFVGVIVFLASNVFDLQQVSPRAAFGERGEAREEVSERDKDDGSGRVQSESSANGCGGVRSRR